MSDKETLVHNIELPVHEGEETEVVAEAVVLEPNDVTAGQTNPVYEDGTIQKEIENDNAKQHGAQNGAAPDCTPDGVILSVQNLQQVAEGSTTVQIDKRDNQKGEEVRQGIRKTLWYLCSGFGCCIPVWIAKGVKESRMAKEAKKEGNLTTYQMLKNKVQYRWMIAVIPLVIFLPIIIIVLVTRLT
ncbi:PREDICTED: uncharacterized protein LOC109464259 [Branchiostoma belcheri]|uniref:Uncharacterized protein LOC109464259 n=1 Tax=Branchiostoma belcheri TaxID=7741 RepID=A0A6P4Y2U5_BRABE|nr:PREDICTED: uncharacterized protein LOC109464259 [Branchiostoma belcheri]